LFFSKSRKVFQEEKLGQAFENFVCCIMYVDPCEDGAFIIEQRALDTNAGKQLY
jgi:hypothetical protein